MPVIEPATARAFAAAWVDAWNARDLDRVLAHYAEDVEFRSPFVVSIAGEKSGIVKGKQRLRAYWTAALALLPTLRFDLLDVLTGVDSLTLHYRGHRGRVMETFLVDASGRVVAATACYEVQA
jgi:ketosteroid isomerase-like protein